MARERKAWYVLLPLAVFILLEIASLSLLKRSSTLQNIWLNRLSHRVLAFTWGGSERVRNYFKLQQQNETLALQNAELLAELLAYKAREDSYNARLMMDSVRPGRRFRLIPATVTKISRNSAHNYIIIDKGSEDGVKERSGIITSRGVVGIVYAVDRHYAYGLTLMNPKVSVSARVGETGLVAPLQWSGRRSDQAFLQDVPIHYAVSPGDTILTSGFSSIYPAGIPIGVVKGSRLVNGISNQVEIRMFEDFSTLRYVIVAENPDRDALRKLETP
ncbi:MAG: rod shape-determining protein MreC [Bacteroidales bacterium]|nr:rod shape-determining protein MreC [Bacteroidales bacterium]